MRTFIIRLVSGLYFLLFAHTRQCWQSNAQCCDKAERPETGGVCITPSETRKAAQEVVPPGEQPSRRKETGEKCTAKQKVVGTGATI